MTLAMLILGLPGFILFSGGSAPKARVEAKSEAKAAIIDQLHPLEPDQAFIDKATGTPDSYGHDSLVASRGMILRYPPWGASVLNGEPARSWLTNFLLTKYKICTTITGGSSFNHTACKYLNKEA